MTTRSTPKLNRNILTETPPRFRMLPPSTLPEIVRRYVRRYRPSTSNSQSPSRYTSNAPSDGRYLYPVTPTGRMPRGNPKPSSISYALGSAGRSPAAWGSGGSGNGEEEERDDDARQEEDAARRGGHHHHDVRA
jgi:hypothetical protein